MSEHVRDWLDSLWKYFYGQPTVDTIRSARDWMRDPPRNTDFLEALSKLSEISINVSLPFRIIIAWAGKEENEEDIVYIEALMPSDDDIFPSIHIIEEKFLERGKYKIACLLVRQEDYERLLVQQNYQLEPIFQGLDDISQFFIGRMDSEHFAIHISKVPLKQQDKMKQYYLGAGLKLGSNTSYEELFRLVNQRKAINSPEA